MSSTDQQASTDADKTERVQRPGTQTGQGTSMRDGAMARTAPRRSPQERVRSSSGRAGAGGAAAAQAAAGARQSTSRGTSRGKRTGPRRVRLTVQRLDPWSVMKISFLVSVALGIAQVVLVAVLWSVLSGMGVFSTVNDLIAEITTGESGAAAFDLMDYIGFGRVVSLGVVVAVINVVLITAWATLAAFLYNICTALVGGAQLTLSDER